MKKSILLVALLFLGIPCLRGQSPASNPYDLLSRVLTPIASVFSPEAQQHALSATLTLEEMTDLPPELAGQRVELLLQPPDRMLIRGIYNGQMVTICRVGQSVWIAPSVPPFDALTNPPGNPGKKKKGQSTLDQMVLPFPPQQLVLLPVLLQVKDMGEEKSARVLDVKLMQELAKGLGIEDWSARLALNPDGKLARLGITGLQWKLGVRVERLEFATELPAATWQAPDGAIQLTPRQVHQWLDEWGRQMEPQPQTPKVAK